jgi:hypothetical protein
MVGLAAAKARAAPAAAPTVMDANKLAAAGTRQARGESPAKIAKAFGSAAPRSTGTWPLRAIKTARRTATHAGSRATSRARRPAPGAATGPFTTAVSITLAGIGGAGSGCRRPARPATSASRPAPGRPRRSRRTRLPKHAPLRYEDEPAVSSMRRNHDARRSGVQPLWISSGKGTPLRGRSRNCSSSVDPGSPSARCRASRSRNAYAQSAVRDRGVVVAEGAG